MDNASMIQRGLRHVWHPCTQMKLHESQPPVPIARAEGLWLHDFEAHRYLDGISAWWVNLFGHKHPRIKAALRDQLDRLGYVMLAGFTHGPVVVLSDSQTAVQPQLIGRNDEAMAAMQGLRDRDIWVQAVHTEADVDPLVDALTILATATR